MVAAESVSKKPLLLPFNPYEVPRLSRDKLPLGADVLLVSAVLVLASAVSGHVCWRDFSQQAQTLCVCTKHVWRLCHHGPGECREALVRSAAA
jgi:hypothetical protein